MEGYGTILLHCPHEADARYIPDLSGTQRRSKSVGASQNRRVKMSRIHQNPTDITMKHHETPDVYEIVYMKKHEFKQNQVSQVADVLFYE